MKKQYYYNNQNLNLGNFQYNPKVIEKLENKIIKKESLSKKELYIMINYVLNILKEEYQINPNFKIYYGLDYLFELIFKDKFNTEALKRKINLVGYYDFNKNIEKNIALNGLYYKYNYFRNKKKPYLKDINLVYIYAAIHEFRHAYQINKIKETIGSGVFDAYSYDVLNGFLVSEANREFYQKYHKYFESEIDANLNTNQNLINKADRPFYRLFSKYEKALISGIKYQQSLRTTDTYSMVENKLKDFNLMDNPSYLLNDFSLLEHCYLKDFPISQLIEVRENLLETITEKMLEKDNFHFGLRQMRSTVDFFNYLTVKKFTNYSTNNFEKVISNVRLDTAIKIRNILAENKFRQLNFETDIDNLISNKQKKITLK